MALADDGNYRESRWFTRWARRGQVDMFTLPESLARHNGGEDVVAFGDFCLELPDATIGVESCEELFAPDSPTRAMGLSGVDIVCNASGSHHELRKLNKRIDLILNSTAKDGGVYLYSNQNGCDGGRLGFDGCAMVASNGKLLKQGKQFSLADVEVVTATVDLDEVVRYRGQKASRRVQVSDVGGEIVPRVQVRSWNLCQTAPTTPNVTSPIATGPYIHRAEEEIAMGPAVWLWDYLRRSGASGFFLPLSGGADSASTVTIVYSMCKMVIDTMMMTEGEDDGEVIRKDLIRILGNVSNEELSQLTSHPRRLMGRLMHTAYLATENSSPQTRALAEKLAKELGANHTTLELEHAVRNVTGLMDGFLGGRAMKFQATGGESKSEDITLQNVQARLRMVTSYMLAGMLPWLKWKQDGGFLLVLGSSNVDEALMGYITKYDCSSADVNPIGSISKVDLRAFLRWAAHEFDLPTLKAIVTQKSTAELKPLQAKQVSETEMGLTFEELSLFGRLRKDRCLGPVGMYSTIVSEGLLPGKSHEDIAVVVKRFFHEYGIKRHKATTFTPSYHAESYSPDDNRFDLRPFLYPNQWTFQFDKIDGMVKGRHHHQISGAKIVGGKGMSVPLPGGGGITTSDVKNVVGSNQPSLVLKRSWSSALVRKLLVKVIV